MAEILVKFDEPIRAPTGETYFAQAVGKEVRGGLWEGWLEFLPVGTGSVVASGRETTQPNRTDVEYWAQGLTRVYLDGALVRALSLAEAPGDEESTADEPPRFTSPPRRGAPPSTSAPLNPRPILNPFDVYAQGEQILRSELNALSRDHLDSIAKAYRLGGDSQAGTSSGGNSALVEAIIADVRDKALRPAESGESRVGL